MDLHAFDFGMELRIPGRTKGTVVETVLAEAGRDGSEPRAAGAGAQAPGARHGEDRPRGHPPRRDEALKGVDESKAFDLFARSNLAYICLCGHRPSDTLEGIGQCPTILEHRTTLKSRYPLP